MPRAIFGAAFALVVCAACGGSKEPPAEAKVAQPEAEVTPEKSPAPAASTDTHIAPQADVPGATPGGNTPPPPPPPMGAGLNPPTRDSAFGPRFKVDANGKVIPIKRP